ncbi:glycoside hydrolase [Neoconidiobolus thromboides FSU 785]|nr:glycoside hydrolase [Neoconidiobolus thromboides FSU 785]
MKLLLFLLSLLPFIFSTKKVIVGYYVPWGKLEPENIPYKKLTHINYGFGILTNKKNVSEIKIDRYYDGNRIKKIITLAKQHNVKVLLSVGGWTGSQTMSLIVRDKEERKRFIENCLLYLRVNTLPEWEENPNGWGFDGIDIDWEYPGRKGSMCNSYDIQDSENYLKLLKELRESIDKEFTKEKKLITAAVRCEPFDNSYGQPMKDVSSYAKYFDFINIMAYDSMGPWSDTTGPNSPFLLHKKIDKNSFSFIESIDNWIQAKFPINQITVGMPFYGRTFLTTEDMSLNPNKIFVNKAKEIPKGDESDSNEPNFYCNEGSTYSGIYKYKFIRKDIIVNNNVNTIIINGYKKYWDNSTMSPWLFNSQQNKFISYDDIESIKLKVDYANKIGLLGVMFWELSHDYEDELIDQLQFINTKRESYEDYHYYFNKYKKLEYINSRIYESNNRNNSSIKSKKIIYN